MADDIVIPTTGAIGTENPIVATDEVATRHFQRVKLDLGSDGVSTPVVDELPTSSKRYATRFEELPTVTYFGEAVIGSAEGDSVWRIRKLTISGDITTTEWADGDDLFDNAWTARAGLSYS